uniref:Uncharacterized protein n=1 Tax=Grammatophora oceanica TaxID=210454 RepID=A0A7S1YAP7_9STRA|mmetsp:Transcript_35739/g.53288  ORF Transcript_35739/g.53288 Transcript_35739/m.53288 type:complete len:296 (+) Transcript_35739:57-944(+)
MLVTSAFPPFLACLLLTTPTLAQPEEPECPAGSTKVIINFDKLPDGSMAEAGEAANEQWEEVGVIFTGNRRLPKRGRQPSDPPPLRLFDSSDPTFDDYDLGSPNEACGFCDDSVLCPGVATHNKKAARETNCESQRNILIIDSGRPNPDDFRLGGLIDIKFTEPVPKILSLGAMDVQQPSVGVPRTTYNVWELNAGGVSKPGKPVQIEGLGDNTWQQIPIHHTGSITNIKIDVQGTFGLTHVRFCSELPHNLGDGDFVEAVSLTEPNKKPPGQPSNNAIPWILCWDELAMEYYRC